MPLSLVVFLTCICSLSCRYHHVILDQNQRYHLFWKLEDRNDSMIFRVEVQTKGYVGLGISPHGGMAGSDIVIGWVKNGTPYLQDCHARGNEMPSLDDQQDWELLSGYENDTHTVLQFRRILDTCDEEDVPISDNTARLIYAYHEEDPLSKDVFKYHGRINRGTRSIMLLQPLVETGELPPNTQEWDVRLPNITIPHTVDTTYWCKVVKAPTLNRKHHVIKIAPLVSKESAPYVHHMVLYRCLGATARELEPHVHHTGHPCYVPNMPETYSKCESVYAAWGIGALAMVMPDKAGLPLGDKANIYFLLEVHYDNANFQSGFIDQSGFRIYYTPHIRQYEAMTLMIGVAVDPCVVVPPGRKQFVVAGHADPDCLAPAIPEDGIKIFAVFLHSHLLGRKIKLRHIRNGTELPYIAADDSYDFNYQEYRYLQDEVTVKAGDHLVMECTYNSSGRNHTTFGGLGTGEEMCLAFVLYYPRIARARALSSPTCDLVRSLTGMETRKEHAEDEDSNHTFYQHFQNDPWIPNYMDIAEAAMRFGYHRPQCFLGDGIRLQMPRLITYPKEFRSYSETNRCSNQKFAEQRWAEKSNGAPKSCQFLLFYILAGAFILAVVMRKN